MEDKKKGLLDTIGTPLAVVVGALVIAGAIYLGPGEPKPAQEAELPKGNVNIEQVKMDDSPYFGNALAPVTMAVWYDFRCRYCKTFEGAALKTIGEKYVATGKVRIVYKDYQFLGDESVEAGVYSRAVWEVSREKWHDWFDHMMTAPEVGHDVASMSAVAGPLGIDTAKVEKLTVEKRAVYLARMEADKEEGSGFGISGTPGSILGETLIGGAQPFAKIEPTILELLK